MNNRRQVIIGIVSRETPSFSKEWFKKGLQANSSHPIDSGYKEDSQERILE
jgi:hypothetical protein